MGDEAPKPDGVNTLARTNGATVTDLNRYSSSCLRRQ